ncbi:MAG TPA: GntR family transcriptional regulator, partial [Cupriavidus sp.]|nr:GntR family transcriptional regulator [Cupriavidus sp.]
EPHVKSMGLSLVGLQDAWARRSLLIGMRDPAGLTVSARLLISHLCGDRAPF